MILSIDRCYKWAMVVEGCSLTLEQCNWSWQECVHLEVCVIVAGIERGRTHFKMSVLVELLATCVHS